MLIDYPELYDDIDIYETRAILGKKTIYIIGSKTLDRTIKIDKSKIELVKELRVHLDGSNSIQEINNKLHLKNFTVKIEPILELFAKNGFIVGVKGVSNSEVDLTSKKLVDIPFPSKTNKFVSICCKFIVKLFPFILIGLITFAFLNISIIMEMTINMDVLVSSVLTSFFALCVHEAGHLIYATSNKISVDRMRVSLLWGVMPMVYIKYSNLYFLQPKKRLLLILSGVMANMLCSLASIVVYFFTKSPLAISLLYTNTGCFLMNLYPQQATDGYFALCTLFNKHNLRLEILQSIFKPIKSLSLGMKVLVSIYFFLITSASVGFGLMLYNGMLFLFPQVFTKHSIVVIVAIVLLIVFQIVSVFVKMRKEFKKIRRSE